MTYRRWSRHPAPARY